MPSPLCVQAMISAVNATGKIASIRPAEQASAPEQQYGSNTLVLHVEGMMCTRSCTPAVEKALRAVPGVIDVQVSLPDKSARVTGSADPAALVAAVNATGKIATMPKGGDQMMAAALVEPASSSDEVVLHVEGMMCTRSCTPAVAAALRAVPGVEEVSVSLEDKSARVRGLWLFDFFTSNVVFE